MLYHNRLSNARSVKVVSVSHADDESGALAVVICLAESGRPQEYLRRSMGEVKGLMARIKRRMRTPGEQSQIERWLQELEIAEVTHNLASIGQILDSFFEAILTKLD